MTAPPNANDQSQWALVWRQFRKRRLAVWSLGLIVTLGTVAIFAPFLANDRPFFYRGVNRFEYRESVRTLRELLQRLATETTEQAGSDTAATLRKSLALQERLMRAALPSEQGTTLGELLETARKLAGTPDGPREIGELRKRLQTEFGQRDQPLVTRNHWPIFASLNGLEVGFMVWNVVLLTLPLWRRGLAPWLHPERTVLRRNLLLGLWLVVPTLAGTVWWSLVPSRIDRTNYKEGVRAASEEAPSALVVYDSVIWPAVAFGIDEDDLSHREAPPAWSRKPEKPTESGRATTAKSLAWNGPHWLGTDSLGRDILCRMIWGGRVSLSVGIVAVSIYVTIGIIIGAIAGYFRGVVDLVISRIIEVIICFPAFFLILTIVAFVGPSIFNIMVIIGLTGWTGIARLIRGEFLRLVDQEFVLAGRALGYSPTRLIFRHILPNAIAPVMVSASFGVASAILTESSLSFLGLGISVPTPSWGGMLSSGREAIFRAPWIIWYPGLVIFITISCYNFVGEALRDASDPRLRGSR